MELEEAIRALERTRPVQAADGLVRLAELRRRQGRFDEMALVLEKANSHPLRMLAGHLVIVGHAAMALRSGRRRDRHQPGGTLPPRHRG